MAKEKKNDPINPLEDKDKKIDYKWLIFLFDMLQLICSISFNHTFLISLSLLANPLLKLVLIFMTLRYTIFLFFTYLHLFCSQISIFSPSELIHKFSQTYGKINFELAPFGEVIYDKTLTNAFTVADPIDACSPLINT